MRFSDKLSKQRKNNNLSQEQLADKLGVSRQAVSKWESGTSYPDMDKIIKMCSILNCTLEDLLDDGVISESASSTKNKPNIQNYIQDVLKVVTKTMNMFISMKFKEKIKCIFEMFCYGCLLFILGLIVFSILSFLTSNILSFLPNNLEYFISNFFDQIYLIALIILGIILFIHLFKIRYLDYFITIEDQNVNNKTLEEPIEKKETKHYIEKEKETIIIRDQKHSSFSLINLLWKFVVYIAKFCVGLMLLVAVFCFVAFIVLAVASLVFIKYNSIFLFLSLALIFIAITNFLIVYYFYHFIFNKHYFIKKPFLIFCASLIGMGVSFGLIFAKSLQFDYINTYDDLSYTTSIETMEYERDTKLFIYTDINNITYKVDNSLGNSIKLEITQPDIFSYGISTYYIYDDELEYTYRILEVSDSTSFSPCFNTILNDLKHNTIREIDTFQSMEVTVYASEDILPSLYSNSGIVE